MAGLARIRNNDAQSQRRPCESRDPYAVSFFKRRCSMAFASQLKPVVMGPCFRRDDERARGTHAVLYNKSSYSAKAEYPVRRGFSVLSPTPRNTGSPGHRRAEATPSFVRLCRAMTTEEISNSHTSAISPHVCARFVLFVWPSPKKEGAGNAGCALHPRSRVQKCVEKTHTSIQVQRKHPTFPAQWFYGL
jgi:hypothetical protein